MEKLKLFFLAFSTLAILACFGVSVWLYMNGQGWLYMALFALALVWQVLVFRNYLKQRNNKE